MGRYYLSNKGLLQTRLSMVPRSLSKKFILLLGQKTPRYFLERAPDYGNLCEFEGFVSCLMLKMYASS